MTTKTLPRPTLDTLTCADAVALAKWLDAHPAEREAMRYWDHLFNGTLPLGSIVVMVLGGDWRQLV